MIEAITTEVTYVEYRVYYFNPITKNVIQTSDEINIAIIQNGEGSVNFSPHEIVTLNHTNTFVQAIAGAINQLLPNVKNAITNRVSADYPGQRIEWAIDQQ